MIALTFGLLSAVGQPSWPLAECVISTPGPILVNKAATASVEIEAFAGPFCAPPCPQKWSSEAASWGNWTPGKKFGQMPRRKPVKLLSSPGVGV
jgi:hypothetical protein